MAYAVLFKTHIWDQTVIKLYDLLCSKAKHGQIFVIIDDDTAQFDDPPGTSVIRYGHGHLQRCGLENTGSFWANGDYQTILFWLDHSHFDYYVSVEYDVAVGVDLDAIIASMEANRIDSLSEPVSEDIAHWPHLGSCVDFYNFRDIKPGLFCISFFSRAMVAAIYARRLLQVQQKRKLATNLFPLGEAVLGSEPGIMGLNEDRLLNHCANLNTYRWNRAIPLEMVTDDLLQDSILHPVSSLSKVIRSNLFPNVRSLDQNLLEVAETIRHAGFYKKVYDLPDNLEDQRKTIDASAKQHLSPEQYAVFFTGMAEVTGISCFQSSTSEYSTGDYESQLIFQTPPVGNYRIHTSLEDNPFWCVTFSQPTHIKSLYVFDREDIHRYYIYEVTVTSHGEKEIVYASEHPEYLGNIIDGPKTISINRDATELRISIRGRGMIHFDAVQCDLSPIVAMPMDDHTRISKFVPELVRNE